MKKKLLAIFLAVAMSMSLLPMGVLAENSSDGGETAAVIAMVGGTTYTTLSEAIDAVKANGGTIQLMPGEFELGTVQFPAELSKVTFQGAPNKATILKNTLIKAADGNTISYQEITFDGIVFDNSQLLFTGWRANAQFGDWTITNCEFKNIDGTTSDSNSVAAVHFNLSAEASEHMTNFVFTNNTINGVTATSASGVHVNAIKGSIAFTDNMITDVAFNAIQIQNSDNFSVITIEDNVLESFGTGLLNLSSIDGTISLKRNVFIAPTAEKYLFYNAITEVDASENFFGIGTSMEDVQWNENFSSRVHVYTGGGGSLTAIYPTYKDKELTQLYTPQVAAIGDMTYITLLDAVAAAEDGDTIKLLKDVPLASSYLTIDKTLTIDLNSFDITGSNTYVMLVTGALTVQDSSSAADGMIKNTATSGSLKPTVYVNNGGTLNLMNGTIESPTHAIYAMKNSTVNMTGGTVTSPKIAVNAGSGTAVNVSGGKVIGTDSVGIFALGNVTVVISGDAYVYSENFAVGGNGSAGFDGTTITVKDNAVLEGTLGIYQPQDGVLNIEGGTITGSETGIEVRSGELNMSGGTVTGNGIPTDVQANGSGATTLGAGIAVAQHVTTLPIEINISDGAINGYTAVYESTPENNSNPQDISISITGGTFTSINGGTNVVYSENCDKFISGTAKFNTEPSADYIANEGYYFASFNGYYSLKEKPAGEDINEIPVVTTTTKAEVPDGASEAVETAAASVTAAATGLNGEANEHAQENTMTTESSITTDDGNKTVKEAVTALASGNSEMTEVDDSTNPVQLVVVTSLDIEVKDAEVGEADSGAPAPITSMTVEITPMAHTVATTQAVLDANEAGTGAIITEGEGQNAIIVEADHLINVTTPVNITLGIPASMGTATTGGKLYIQHKGYEYTGTVNEVSDGVFTVTFLNPHGFSEFTISTEPQTVAKIGETSYTSLQAAVDAVENGQTIVLQKDVAADVVATVSRDVSFTLSTNSNNFDGAIKAGSNTTMEYNEETDTYTFDYTRPSSGSGGGVTTYTITVPSVENGTVTATPKTAAKNATVTLTVTPADGFELDALTVKDKGGKEVTLTQGTDGKYTFTMPASKVTITAAFKAVETTPCTHFNDVGTGDWFYDEVEYVYHNGIMNGTSDSTFDPNGATTRAMVWTMLARLDGETISGADWADQARTWAMAAGVSDGTDPNGEVTREMLGTMLYRYAGLKGYDLSAQGDLSKFLDGNTVSDWANAAMVWANGAGIITGDDQSKVNPLNDATRAEVAAMFMRFCENIVK